MKKINILILCLFSGASWASDVDNVKCIRVDSKDIEGYSIAGMNH